MAADAVPGRATRILRAFRAEWRRARRQPALLAYLAIAVLAAGLWGPLQHRSAKAEEAEVLPEAKVTHSFGAPAPPVQKRTAIEGRGANGFLTLAAAMRAGVMISAILLLLYAAGLLAGEGAAGTYRLLLTRPVERSEILLAKALLLLVVVLSFAGAVALTGAVAGLFTGGYGDFVDPRFGQVDYKAAELLRVALVSIALAPAALFAVACFGLFLSSIFDSSGTAVTAATLGGIAALAANLALPADLANLNFLTHVEKYLTAFSSHARGLSDHRFDSRFTLPGVIVPTLSALAFLLLARIIFGRRDIHA